MHKISAYLSATAVVIICTLINVATFRLVDTSNTIMIYLLGVVIVATWLSEYRGPPILAATLSTAVFAYCFLEPRFPFEFGYTSDIVTVVVMFLIAQVINYLTITMRRHILAARQAQVEAETEKCRNMLLLSISHDLRTPLAGIMGSASSLIEDGQRLEPKPREELTKSIYHESARLCRIINNILQIARLDSGINKLAKQSHDLEEIIGAVLNKLENSLANRSLRTYLPESIPLIQIDHVLIEQVFINLLENAHKYSAAETPIEIHLEIQPQHVLIKVADCGPGIHPAELTAIFNKFYRNERSPKKGFGLGLSICKSIIVAHHGAIWAENRAGGGAQFLFTLPLGDTL